ncbi:MAG: hypothetical protein IKD81_01315 [Eubacteriaceae bacterium]|nr:hypothetical protein [Eubacteriaceae bacterium]
MKKYIILLLCALMLPAMAGCGGAVSSKPANQTTGVNDVLEQGVAAEDSQNEGTQGQTADGGPSAGTQQQNVEETVPPALPASEGPEPETETYVPQPEEGIDVDLTVLSSTMVYSEVSNMLQYPEEYIGKTVKMDGIYAYIHDASTGNEYYVCIIQDATACCSRGIEFVLTDDYVYPDDYPEVNEEICVVGVFDIYEENGYMYCTLRDAELI